jgi:cytochrome c peroxidase
MLFHDARICYQQWQSCASCHPDGRSDGLNWDLLNDGAGSLRNTKSLLLAHRTPPAMSLGVRDSAQTAVRSGIRHILSAEPREDVASAIDAYLQSLQPIPGPQRIRKSRRDALIRGEKLFGTEGVGCARCHPAPLYTDRQMHTMGAPDVLGHRRFDTPSLIEVWRTAPYLHDGRYTTIKQVLVEGTHGLTPAQRKRLTADDIDDLVAYVQSL